MRALVQRVSRASVSVQAEVVAEIGAGLLVLLGVGSGDDEATAERLAAKVAALRIFEDGDGRMNEALGEREVLCVSQFTLYADTVKGNRPSFTGRRPARVGRTALRAVLRTSCGQARGLRSHDGRRVGQRRPRHPDARDLASERLQRPFQARRPRLYSGTLVPKHPNPFREVGPGPPFFGPGCGGGVRGKNAGIAGENRK